MKRSSTPIESFGPEVLNALIEGSKRRLEVSLPYRQCLALRQRMHKLRALMARERHPLHRAVSRTRIQIVWGKKAGFPSDVPENVSSKNVAQPKDLGTPAKLILAPHDSEYQEALIKAGISVEQLTHDPLRESLSNSEDTTNPLDRLLDDYSEDEKKP